MNLIFDLDGTLFQTRLCIVDAVRRLFSDHGWEQIEEERIVSNIGKASPAFLGAILPEGVAWEEVYQVFSTYERAAIRENAQLFDGSKELIQELFEEGYHMYLCSTGSEEYIRLVLEKTQILKYFEKIVSAKYVSKNEAVKQLLEIDSSAIMIGDTVSDFSAAISNMIPCIGVTYGYGGEKDFEKATYLAKTAFEVKSYIKRIELFQYLIHGIGSNKVVGINGVDTSGKSIFTEQFAKFVQSVGKKVQILHIDDFHNPSRIRYSGNNEIDAYYDHAFNYKQVIDEILEPLRKTGSLHRDVLCLNLDTDQYENLIHFDLDDDTVLLIEGVLLFRKPILSYLDYKIYLHIEFEEVLRRAKIRDVPKYGEAFLQKYKDKYIPIQKRYIDENDPIHSCDIAINNENFFLPSIIENRK